MWLKQAFFVRKTCFNYWKKQKSLKMCSKNFSACADNVDVSVLVCRVYCLF